MRLKLLLTLAALLPSMPAFAQSLSPAESATVDGIVADALKTTGVPSASVAIVRDGKLAFARAYGRQSPSIPAARADAKYQIASISKQFTAAAILLLRDEGKLSLDDTVAKWVPGVTDGDHVTIRELLSHTSGLQDYWPQDYSFAAMETPTTPQAIVNRWAKKPLDFAPGSQWQYSNTGYVIAGMIVEKASGMPLLAFLQAHVFKPLGIDAIDQDKAQGAGFPLPYHRYALGPVRPERPAAAGWLYAAGELAMSASDLARWDIARMDRAVLPAADWAEQETPVRLTDGRSSGYGLGVFVGTDHHQKAISHDGEAVGFLSGNTVYPESRDAIVVFVNADFGDTTGTITDAIASKVLFPPAPGLTGTDEATATAHAKATFAALQQGRLDRAAFTPDCLYYFTPEAVGDYRSSLGALGAPKAFTALGGPRLRGGFVNRNYQVDLGTQKLTIVTYAERGANGRYEQFLVMPAS